MKAVILGAGGQLGSELAAAVPSGIEAHSLTRAMCDITDEGAVREAIGRAKPDWVINAAAYTAVDRAEADERTAMRINAEGARNVAAAAENTGARLIHISSDYVFDGQSSVPYSPSDPVSPLSAYGRSKAAGEAAISSITDRAILVRSGWLHSRFGHNFVKTIIRLLGQKETLPVVDDQTGVPTSSADLARTLWWLAINDAPAGIMHWVNADRGTWFDFAAAINSLAAARSLVPRGREVTRISTETFGAAAPRPRFSVLDATGTWRLQNATPRDWRAGVRDTIDAL